MTRPTPPALTVRYEGSARTVAAGNDVVVGRDLRADIRVAHPLISRAHLILRFDQGRWLAIDNGSLNGMYVNNQRVPVVDITDGLAINIGNPDGPRLTFEVGRVQGSVGTPPQTSSIPVAARPSASWPSAPPQPAYPQTPPPSAYPHTSPPPSRSQPMYPSAQQPRYPSGPPQGPPSGLQRKPSGTNSYAPPSAPGSDAYPATALGPSAVPRQQEGNLATSMLKILRPGRTDVPAGSVKIGRATDNDIVIPDVLASRHHATLIPSPGGTEIRDNKSINGTFVNGQRVDSAVLRDNDVVTIGNVDLVFSRGTLARRTETEAATRTGGLDVYGVTWTIEGNKTLLDNISLSARPGTLTAIIGPSGAGKSTLARLVAGYTHPSSGQVSFEGHQGRPRTGRQRGARRTRDDQAPRHPRRQTLRRPAQARLRRTRAADRPVAVDPRRAHVGSRPGAGPPGHDDAAPAGRRGPRRARRDAFADLSRRVRPSAAAGAGRQDGVPRTAQHDRP
jgi:pSer/pThr/pTyr-binding forkhead associated (FHA) protein